MMHMDTDTNGYPVFLIIFGWITEGWKNYSHNYRYYVSQCPVSPFGRTTKFLSQDRRMAMGWPRRRFIYTHVPSKWSWVELSMTTIPCCQCLLSTLLVNNGGYHWPALDWWTTLKSLVNSCWKNINQTTFTQKLLWKFMLHLLINKTGWGSKHHNKTDTAILPNS